MRSLLLGVLCCGIALTGCSYFGYRKYKQPEWAPPELAARVAFPDTYESGVLLTGPMVAALEVAMNDFLPPGTKPRDEASPVSRCLSLRETFRVSVWQPQDNDIVFVRFTPDLTQCAPGALITDGGAEYAIDGSGRILARQ